MRRSAPRMLLALAALALAACSSPTAPHAKAIPNCQVTVGGHPC